MDQKLEEKVKLPEALSVPLGNMVVVYDGWTWSDEEEQGEIMLSVRWGGRRYDCSLLVPLGAASVGSRLAVDCERLLQEVAEQEAQLGYFRSYVEKIDICVERAAKRLYKRFVSTEICPRQLRPRRKRRQHK